MGKLIHTIKLNNEKHVSGTVSATRESATRKYEACLVATTTEKSIEIALAKKAELEAKLVEAEAKLAAECAKWGMTAEQAEAEHKERSERWYDRTDGYLETASKIREEQAARTGVKSWTIDRDSVEKLAKADLKKRGFVDPYDKENTSYGICAANHEVESLKGNLKYHKIPVLGSQGVISWHGTPALAQKALGSREAEWCRKAGDKVEIRTDIEIKERATRAKKA